MKKSKSYFVIILINSEDFRINESKLRPYRPDTSSYREYRSNLLKKSSWEHVLQQFNLLKKVININSIPVQSKISVEDLDSRWNSKSNLVQNMFFIEEFLRVMEEIDFLNNGK